jgi:uncharacterized membrane protein YdjX (TVP38/TMEM64 family)
MVMSMTEETPVDPTELIFEPQETPLLFRKSVIIGLVVGFLALVALYFVITTFFGVSLQIDAEPFKEWVEERGAFGVLVFILVMALSVLFAPIPNVPIFIAAGLAWGPVLGTVYCMAGLTLGSAVAFEVSRKFGRKHMTKLIGRKYARRIDRLVGNMGGRVVFLTRLMPGVNFDWISFVAGMTAVPFRTFIIFSFLGMIPPTALTVVMGDGLGRDPRITLAAGGVWVIAIVATAAYFWAKRHHFRDTERHEPGKGADPGVNPEAELG